MSDIFSHIPKISIITPNYNGAEYLEDTILSVIGQHYPNLEYIIIDGCSTDGSVEIIKKFESRITYWISEPDSGMYQAIQKGFEKSSGEIMAWINSDDMYHRNAFLTIAEIFNSFPEVNWIVGASTAYDESGRTVHVAQSRRFSKFDFYNHDYKWLQQESVFWRRSLWEKAGSKINTELKYAGDFALWLRFFSLDKLYVTHALIGGFRWRLSKQITLEYLDEYLTEIEKVISSEELGIDDLKILRWYKMISFIESIIKEIKIFRTGAIVKRYRNKYFKPAKCIVFDRISSKFVLKD
jgi:glycosyltransferase involved in cell wall biosynthesis